MIYGHMQYQGSPEGHVQKELQDKVNNVQENRSEQIQKLLQDRVNAYTKDSQVANPKHYTGHPSGIECIQVTEHFGFNLGNVIKYIWRAEDKGAPLQDLKKALWYLTREVEKREKTTS